MRSAQIQGALDVAVTEAGAGIFRYNYQLSNGAGAKRQISGIMIDVPNPARSTKSVEKGWAAIDKKADPYLPANILIANTAPDTQPNLRPGQGTVFAFSSADLPGLVQAHILPRYSEQPLPAPATELTDGQFTDGASEWIRAQLRERDTQERHRLTVHTIGPKLMAEDDNLMRVQNELRDAADLPEFRTMRSRLVEIVSTGTPKATINRATERRNALSKSYCDAAETLAVNRSPGPLTYHKSTCILRADERHGSHFTRYPRGVAPSDPRGRKAPRLLGSISHPVFDSKGSCDGAGRKSPRPCSPGIGRR